MSTMQGFLHNVNNELWTLIVKKNVTGAMFLLTPEQCGLFTDNRLLVVRTSGSPDGSIATVISSKTMEMHSGQYVFVLCHGHVG